MNKMTLLLNAWRAWRHARNQEGSSLRGLITGGASVLAVIAITFYRGDLSPADVGVIAAAITGLDAVLKYAIPDSLHQDPADAPTGPEPKSELTEPPPATARLADQDHSGAGGADSDPDPLLGSRRLFRVRPDGERGATATTRPNPRSDGHGFGDRD